MFRVSIHVVADRVPPQESSVIVQVRDTSLADAAAVVIAEARVMSTAPEPDADAAAGLRIAGVEIELDDPLPGATVWAHIDVDADGRVSDGDYVTTQSYPLPQGADEATMVVAVRRV